LKQKKSMENKKQLKWIIIPLSLITIFIIIFSTIYYFTNNTELSNISWEEKQIQAWEIDTGNIIENTDSSDPINVQDKISRIKKKLALKWLIIKWDIHLKNKEYTIALSKYLQILKDIPDDKSTLLKLWNTYFYLKKYPQAYKYYAQIKNYKRLDMDRAILSLIYSRMLSEKNIAYIKSEIDTFPLHEDQIYYYKTSLFCIEDFSLCKQDFQDYFIQKTWSDTENIEWENNTQSWALVEDPYIFEELENIKLALENYTNFQIDDISYKNALISWAFFKNRLYPIAIHLSKNILWEKDDYGPIIKIVAKSHYELWNYSEAKKYLVQYNSLWNKEADVSYFLWAVYERLHEYVLSSVHLKKAIELWYNNSLDVRRRMVYNYERLWETEKVLQALQDIVENNKETLTPQDLSLAIYHHIINEKQSLAKEFSSFGIEKFPEEAIFLWYMWWIQLQETETEEYLVLAEENLKKWLELNKKNPMIYLIMWKLEQAKWDNKKAFIYFKKTVSLDKWWDFGKMAGEELDKLKEMEKGKLELK